LTLSGEGSPNARATPGQGDDRTFRITYLASFFGERSVDLYETAVAGDSSRFGHGVALLVGGLWLAARQQNKPITPAPVNKSLQYSEGTSTRHRQVLRRKMGLERYAREPP
jgi:hypothetical protein